MSRAFFYGNLTKLAIFLRNWLTDKAKKVFLLISFQCVTCNLGNLHASKNHLKSALLPTSFYTFPSHTGKLKRKLKKYLQFLPDVDTHEPDEKSLITYISSLYETFPEPPAVHPLFDAESQRRAAAYTDQAAIHRAWLHENCTLMQVSD